MNPSGDTVDVLFDGPVTPETRFEGLVAIRFDRGKVTIVVEGYKEGALNYKMEKAYDGASGTVDGTVIVVARPVAEARVDSVGISPDTLRVSTAIPIVRSEANNSARGYWGTWMQLMNCCGDTGFLIVPAFLPLGFPLNGL